MLSLLLPIISLCSLSNAYTFSPNPATSTFLLNSQTKSIKKTKLAAGGFEWDDPQEAFDQDVSNPFKNADFEFGDNEEGDEGTLTVDAARLLSPRLEGTNIYLIGMMGCGKYCFTTCAMLFIISIDNNNTNSYELSGKSAVGDVLARRKFFF